jgi:hypothetical protein
MDGKIQQAGPLTQTIRLTHLTSGNYVLEIANANQKQFTKLMKVD